MKVDGKFGFMDKTGKIVITPVYAEVADFSEGLAKALKFNSARGVNKFGYIDKTGKEVK